MRWFSIALAILLAAAGIFWVLGGADEAAAPAIELAAHETGGEAEAGALAPLEGASRTGTPQVDRAAGEAEQAAAPSSEPTCAERFELGDIWIRWLDRAGQPCAAPRASLFGTVPADAGEEAQWRESGAFQGSEDELAAFLKSQRARRAAPYLAHAGEQLWKRANVDWLDTAVAEKSLCLQLDEFFPGAAEVPLAYDAARASPLELRLPPHGTLCVVVQDGGLALPAKTKCKLQLGCAEAQQAFSSVVGREMRIELVKLGVELELHATAFRGQVKELWRIGGPESDGELCRLELAIGAHRPVILGRAADDAGMPLAEHLLQVTLSLDGTTSVSARLLTLPDGRFVWTPELETDAPRRGVLRFSTNAGCTAEVAAVELPAAGIADVGSVRLMPPSSHFGGRVIDANGAPCAKAVVDIYVIHARAAKPARPAPETAELAEAIELFAQRSKSGETIALSEEAPTAEGRAVREILRARPSASSHAVVHADSKGRFTWDDERASDAQNEFLVFAKLGFRASALRTYRGGDRSIELRLEPVGDLVGRTRLEGTAPPPVSLRLRPAKSQFAIDIELARSRFAPNGACSFFNLPPGLYDLDLLSEMPDRSAVGASIAVLRDLVVPAGASCKDLRLDPIDLKASFTRFVFEVDGGPPDRPRREDRAWCRRSNAAEGAWSRLVVPKQGEIAWVLPKAPHDFVFDLEACRRVTMLALSKGGRVEVHPKYRARIHMGVEGISEEELEHSLGHIRFEMSCDPPHAIEPHSQKAGIYELQVGVTGELQIRRFGSAFSSEGAWEDDPEPHATVQIADTAELQTFEVELR